MPKPLDVDKLLRLIGQQLRLNWVYDGANGHAPTQLAQPLVAPTDDTMTKLYHLALSGDLAAIEATAEHLIDTDQTLTPFAKQLQKLARSFEDDAIIAFLERHQTIRE